MCFQLKVELRIILFGFVYKSLSNCWKDQFLILWWLRLCGPDIVNIRWTRSWRTTLRESFWSGPTRFGWFTFFSFDFFIQTDEVLGKDSAEELNKGNNPGPMTEIKFWDAKVGKVVIGWRVWLFVAVHQPRVPLWADEGWHNKKDGVHSQCHWQRLLSVF